MPEFVPGAARGRVRFLATDYASQLYLPTIISRVRREAPGISIEVSAWGAEALRLIEGDEAQLGLNPLGVAPRGFYRRRVAQDRYVVALSSSHRLARARLGVSQFAGAAHVLTVTEMAKSASSIGRCRITESAVTSVCASGTSRPPSPSSALQT